jgi:glutamine amidotransferase
MGNSKAATSVGIVDVGIANLGSIERTLSELAEEVVVVKDGSQFESLERLVLPGVGAFPIAMKRLSEVGLVEDIRDYALRLNRPLLGICLGMQLLISVGEEHEVTKGLDLIGGRVRRFKENPDVRVPHVGWNSVRIDGKSDLFHEVADESDFYFVHSFVVDVEEPSLRIASSVNGERFTAAVQKANIAGVQFHPEKSSKIGRHLLRNFCEWLPC